MDTVQWNQIPDKEGSLQYVCSSTCPTQLPLTIPPDPTDPIAEDERTEKKKQQVLVLTPEVWRVSCCLNHTDSVSHPFLGRHRNTQYYTADDS
jgi:hypothetical protein